MCGLASCDQATRIQSLDHSTSSTWVRVLLRRQAARGPSRKPPWPQNAAMPLPSEHGTTMCLIFSETRAPGHV
jgi:hypothetical protein